LAPAAIAMDDTTIAAFTAQRQVSYCYVAASTFCIYDVILSFSREVEHVWGSKWSSVKVLYFLVRYPIVIYLATMIPMTTSFNLSIEECRGQYYWMFLGIPPLLHFVLDVILLLRVSALYNHSKPVFTFLLIFSFGNLAATLWACIRQANGLAADVVATLPPWQGCNSDPVNITFSLIFYVPNLVLSLIFLSMTLWKVFEIYEVVYGKLTWNSWNKLRVMSPLMSTFVRDGGIFFVVASMACSFSLLSGTVQNEVFKRGGLGPWTFVLYAYSGTHLILNLRAVGKRNKYDQSWDESMSTKVVSGPDGVCMLFA